MQENGAGQSNRHTGSADEHAAIRGNDNLCVVSVHDGLFSQDECRRLIGLQDRLRGEAGKAGLSTGLRDIRRSSVWWLPLEPEHQWVYERIHALAMQQNSRYGFILTAFREPLQIARYADQGHYGWHVDLGKELTATRKLSISVQLSGADEYQGGELQFSGMSGVVIPKTAGTAVTFPSFLAHRVSPVTSGSRYSLVAWIHGPSFR